MRHAVALLLVGAMCLPTAAQKVYEATPFTQEFSAGGRILIVGGKPADPGEYPASFQAGPVGKRCTWFLVGRGTLAGAAHCVAGESPNEPLAQIQLRIAGVVHHATCEISENYWQDVSEDWALCRVVPAAPVPSGGDVEIAGFEVLNANAALLNPNALLEISGYGCYAEGGGVEKDLLYGSARVLSTPPNAVIAGATRPTLNAVTLAGEPQLLCEGDSGGPAFRYAGIGRTYRVVVGINSATAIKAGVSYLASVTTPAAIAFFQGWADRHDQRICGIHEDASGCRPKE